MYVKFVFGKVFFVSGDNVIGRFLGCVVLCLFVAGESVVECIEVLLFADDAVIVSEFVSICECIVFLK